MHQPGLVMHLSPDRITQHNQLLNMGECFTSWISQKCRLNLAHSCILSIVLDSELRSDPLVHESVLHMQIRNQIQPLSC
jgi:hypothetical protein